MGAWPRDKGRHLLGWQRTPGGARPAPQGASLPSWVSLQLGRQEGNHLAHRRALQKHPPS